MFLPPQYHILMKCQGQQDSAGITMVTTFGIFSYILINSSSSSFPDQADTRLAMFLPPQYHILMKCQGQQDSAGITMVTTSNILVHIDQFIFFFSRPSRHQISNVSTSSIPYTDEMSRSARQSCGYHGDRPLEYSHPH